MRALSPWLSLRTPTTTRRRDTGRIAHRVLPSKTQEPVYLQDRTRLVGLGVSHISYVDRGLFSYFN